MGGVAVDVAKFMNEEMELRLVPEAVLFLAREGSFVEISSGMISDKSKASLLGKALVCIQVLWFSIQCVARRAARYPLVLLEIHTMVHVLCALLMYIWWWKAS